VLAANVQPPPLLVYSTDDDAEHDAGWRRVSDELACSPDLSEARVLLGMEVRGLPPLGCTGTASG
jgi:hypothetical protein